MVMKLRLQSNSIRLRLKRREVEQLIKIGRIEEKIIFGRRENDIFRYVLEVAPNISICQASHQPNGILVQVPVEAASLWALSDEVGIETAQTVGEINLQILIEKDFACLNGTEEQNVDTFPHPMTGTTCTPKAL